MRILAIIPAYNEEKAIFATVSEIRKCAPAVEIVVINDCSKDGTESEAERAGASVVNLSFNLGIGGAVQTGYQIAAENGFDIAVQIDGDGQHDPRFLANLLKPVLENQ